MPAGRSIWLSLYSTRIPGALVPNEDLEPFPSLIYNAAHQRTAALPGDLKVDYFSLVLGPEGPGDGQQVHRLKQRCLALGVGAEQHDYPWGQTQVQLQKIAEVAQG